MAALAIMEEEMRRWSMLLAAVGLATLATAPAVAAEMMMKKGETVMMMPNGRIDRVMHTDKMMSDGWLRRDDDGRRRQDVHDERHEDVKRQDGLRYTLSKTVSERDSARRNSQGLVPRMELRHDAPLTELASGPSS
jgi:hypothetical protein